MSNNIKQRIASAPWTDGNVAKNEFSFQSNTTGEKSVVAEFKAQRPLRLRDDPDADLRLTIPAYESFTTDGTGGNTETFSLSSDLLDSPSTESFVIYEDGSRVQADSIDYAGDSFDYTSSGTNTELDVFYVSGEPADVVIRKAAPGAGGTTNQILKGMQAKIIHSRDQSEQEIEFNLTRTQFQAYVPRKFKIQLVVNAPYNVAYAGPSRANGTPRASNALLNLPRRQTEARIRGLGNAVKQDMVL